MLLYKRIRFNYDDLDIGQARFFCVPKGPIQLWSLRNLQQKRTRPISYHFDLSSLINEGFMMVNRTKQVFFSPVVGQKREISSGRDGSILSAWRNDQT